MPLTNRMTPLGVPIAHPSRGLVYGNRGCLHDGAGRIVRPFGTKRWIACRLEFRGWQRDPLLQPGRFTELFFLDEATALAAGHRPCRMCRYEDYIRFVRAWSELHPSLPTTADAIDEVLHAQRWDRERRRARHHNAAIGALADGTFILRGDDPWLVRGTALLRWTPAGYTDRVPRPQQGEAAVITPPSLASILRTRRDPLVPFLHPTALHPTADP
jgi:hypothetical protein